MKQCEIICTLGTTTDSKSVIERMIEFGMTGVRINTAYANIEDYKNRIILAREAAYELMYANLKIMLDIKGPQVRLNDFDFFNIEKGSKFYVGFPGENSDEARKLGFSKNFSSNLSLGDLVLFENGSIRTKVLKMNDSGAFLQVLEPGEGILHKYMGVNVPGVYLDVEKLSFKDKEVIKFGLDNKVDQIALSFVRDCSDVKNCYDFMKEYCVDQAKQTELCLKIEDRFGIKNLDNILNYAKSEQIKVSVMVARGDLFVELPQEELPFAQDYIIRTCANYAVPVILGTGVLSSMQQSKTPSRAEICDVYNSLKSGVNRFMLSGETSYGKNPEFVVKKLSDISRRFYSDTLL